MQTVNITLYQFSELEQEARQKALDKDRYINVEYFDWYEFTFDDFCTICETIGITIDSNKIGFSGFYAQGDGSTFDATVNIIAFIKAVSNSAWKQYAPDLELAISYPPVSSRIINLIENGTIDCALSTKRTRYNNLQVDTDFNYSYNRCDNYNRIDSQLELLEKWAEHSLKAINRYLYQSLQEQYETLTGDTAVRETIESNEYVFTADGKRANRLLEISNH